MFQVKMLINRVILTAQNMREKKASAKKSDEKSSGGSRIRWKSWLASRLHKANN